MWRTTNSEMALTHPALSVEKAWRVDEAGQDHLFIILHSPDWVNVIPITEKGEVVLIRQWRQGSSQVTLEIPGGIVDPGETPAQAGARELREETGYQAGQMIPLGWVNPNPALFTNRCHTFLARGCRLDGPTRLEPSERIEVLTQPLEALPGLVSGGQIRHSLVLSALTYFWMHQGQILSPGR